MLVAAATCLAESLMVATQTSGERGWWSGTAAERINSPGRPIFHVLSEPSAFSGTQAPTVHGPHPRRRRFLSLASNPPPLPLSTPPGPVGPVFGPVVIPKNSKPKKPPANRRQDQVQGQGSRLQKLEASQGSRQKCIRTRQYPGSGTPTPTPSSNSHTHTPQKPKTQAPSQGPSSGVVPPGVWLIGMSSNRLPRPW